MNYSSQYIQGSTRYDPFLSILNPENHICGSREQQKDKDPFKEWMLETNLYRRQLNEFQKSEMGTSLEGIEKEKAEKRLKETQFKPGNPIRSDSQHKRSSHRLSSRVSVLVLG